MAGPPYRPLDAQVIPRFAGIRTFMRAPHVTDLAGVDAVVYGIPFDTATSYRTGPRFGPEAIRSASALIRPYNPALDVNVVDALSHRRLRRRAGVAGRHGAHVRAGRGGARADRRRRASSPPRSAATTRSRSPSCARSRGSTGRSRSCSSTRTATRGSSTSASSTSTARRSSAPSRRASLDAAASVQAGMRGSLYGAGRHQTREGPRLHRADDRRAARSRAAALRRARARDGRRPAGVHVVRHRLPRPGVRARHRHARGRRLLDGGGARVPARAARHQASPAATSSRSRRRTTGRAW